jgi:hypothetical protein
MLLGPRPFTVEARLADLDGEFTGKHFNLEVCLDGEDMAALYPLRGIQSGT